MELILIILGLVQEFFNKTEDGYETTFAVNHLGIFNNLFSDYVLSFKL